MTLLRQRQLQPLAPQPLVLLAAGPASAVAALQSQLGFQLADALGVAWCEPLDPLNPQRALAGLLEQGSGLVPLPLDPGLSLPGTGHWAEALGAWRQPVVLLVANDQLETGLPAAMVALLQQWRVPLVGLVQGGGRWDPSARRGDGLPWLGALEAGLDERTDPADGHQEEQALRQAFSLRWRQIVADR